MEVSIVVFFRRFVRAKDDGAIVSRTKSRLSDEKLATGSMIDHTVRLAPMLFKYATRANAQSRGEINATARARSRRTTSERRGSRKPRLVSEAFTEPFEPRRFGGSKGRTRVTYSHDRHDVFHYDSVDGHPSRCSSFANFEPSATSFPPSLSRTFDKDVVRSSLRFVKLTGVQQINANAVSWYSLGTLQFLFSFVGFMGLK